MSAIFGIFHFDQQPVSPVELSAMDSALTRYGPEGGDTWRHADIGMGHCSMRFTPEDHYDRQPLISADGHRVLVFNGRLDNRRDVASQLKVSGPELDRLPDSGLVMMAYERWGESLLDKLIGSHTFAIWDGARQSLLIARAPIQGLPLCFHTTPKTFVFATMRKGLFALPHVPRALNEQTLADYLAFAPFESGQGFYREIERLPAGHVLYVNRDGVSSKGFWQLDLTRSVSYPNDEDYVEAFNEVFSTAVESKLRSQTPVGVMMSGGLDSSSVAAMAAPRLKKRGERLMAFTEVPSSTFQDPVVEGYYADETPYVRAIAGTHDNLDLELIRTDGQFYLERLNDYFDAAEVPFRNAANRTYTEAIYQAAQAKGIKNLLTGGQGNMTISWHGGGLLPDLLRRGRVLQAFSEARSLASRGRGRSTMRTLVLQGLLPLLPSSAWLKLMRLWNRKDSSWKTDLPWAKFSALNPEFAVAHRVKERAIEKGHDFAFRPPSESRFLRENFITNVGNLFDGLFFGYQAMFGVCALDPTTDQRLVEFCLSLPEEQFSKGGVQRRLIRRAMVGRLPNEVVRNEKRGLQTADWFERLTGNVSQIQDALARIESSDLARQVIDLPRLHRLVDSISGADHQARAFMRDNRGVLDFGLMTGSFISWFEEQA